MVEVRARIVASNWVALLLPELLWLDAVAADMAVV